MADLRQQWAEISELLSQTLDEIRSALDSQTLDVVRDYLEHNELELAYRSIHEAVEEGGLLLSPAAVTYLKRAAHLMKIEP